jgi:hypothetical protein
MSSQAEKKDAPGYRYPLDGGALSGTEYGDWSPAKAQTGASDIAAPAAKPNHLTLSGVARRPSSSGGLLACFLMTPPERIDVYIKIQRYDQTPTLPCQ